MSSFPLRRGKIFWAAALALPPLFYAGFVTVDPLVVAWLRQNLPPALLQTAEMVTDVGKSHWILISSGLLFLALAAACWKDVNRWRQAIWWHLAGMPGFVFLSVAGAGLTTQFFKHLIGRARPKHFEALGPDAFSPLAFRSDFASFPSGHTTTLFALAMALSLLWPALRWPAFFLALAFSLTRVLVGAHYPMDILGGIGVGIVFPWFLAKAWAGKGWVFSISPAGDLTVRLGKKLPRLLARLQKKT